MTAHSRKIKSKFAKISCLCGSLLTILLVVNPVGSYIDKTVVNPYVTAVVNDCNSYQNKKLDVIYDYLYQKSLTNEEDKKLWNQSVAKNRQENAHEIPNID